MIGYIILEDYVDAVEVYKSRLYTSREEAEAVVAQNKNNGPWYQLVIREVSLKSECETCGCMNIINELREILKKIKKLEAAHE